MPRPYKPLKQRPNGVWFVQIKDKNGNRLTKSLETKDPLKATARAQQALQELQEEAEGQAPQRWRADEQAVIWDQQADGSFKERHTTAAEIYEPEDLRETSWYDLVREADSKWKRKHGKGYSDSWHINVNKAIKSCPHDQPLRITAKQINAWIKQQQQEGLAPKTIQGRCALLSGLLSNSIKSGLLEGYANPFTQTDYSTNVVKSHPTPEAPEYQRLFEADLPELARLPLYLMAYTGMRIGEVQGLKKGDVGVNTVTITDGKTDSSNRVLPIPSWLTAELKRSDFNWASNTYLNEQVKAAGPDITCHSLRHGWKRLSREAELDTCLGAFLGHSLKGLEGRMEMASALMPYDVEPRKCGESWILGG